MEPTPVSSSSDRLVLGMPLNGVNTLIACLHLPQEDLEYIYDKLSRRTQAGKGRTAQLAATEARATEAAAEAGKVAGLLVKAETELASLRDRLAQEQRITAQQEVQTLALVREAQRNREWHLQRMAAVEDRASQDVDSESFGNGVFWYIGYDKGNYTTPAPSSPAAVWPAAAAPVAPQQQEGGRYGVNPHKDQSFHGCWGNSSCPCDSKCPEDCPLYLPTE